MLPDIFDDEIDEVRNVTDRTRLTVLIDVRFLREYLYLSATAHASRSASSTGTLTPKGQLLPIIIF